MAENCPNAGVFTTSLGETIHIRIILWSLTVTVVEMFMKHLLCPLVLLFKLSHCRVDNISVTLLYLLKSDITYLAALL